MPDSATPIPEQNNVFLIDWLSFTAHGTTVENMKKLLGLDDAAIPWQDEERFQNGYPMQCFWNGINIGYGADEERFYKDPSKVRSDMGINVRLSGSGCRAYESYGANCWGKLLDEVRTLVPDAAHGHKRYNVTRLDLAYDDHEGMLDILQMESDIRHRNFVSRTKYAEITWSDDQKKDIQGLNLQIGSDKSLFKVRIYDKAAERGFQDRHWVRVEMQLRDERASAAVIHLADEPVLGKVVSGILRNYLTFRTPEPDTNKSRWPIADYWENILDNLEKIPLWASPGEEYNLAKTEYWMLKQYGPVLRILNEVYGPEHIQDRVEKLYPLDQLSKKHKIALADFRLSGGS